MKLRRVVLGLFAGVLAGLAGCAVGPDYQPPKTETPAGFDAGAVSGIPPPAAQPAEEQRWWTDPGGPGTGFARSSAPCRPTSTWRSR